MNKTLSCWLLAAAFSASPVNAQENRVEGPAIRNLVLQDVRQQGIDKAPEVQIALRVAHETVLIRAWEKRVLASEPVTPAMKEVIYKELTALLGDKEYKIFHVLLSDEKAALGLVAKMKESPDWTSLDPKRAISPEVKFTANRTDWVNLSAVSREFHPQVRSMKAREFSDQPIRVKEGWQVIGVLDVRPFQMPTADRIDKDLVKMAERKIIDRRLTDLLNTPPKN